MTPPLALLLVDDNPDDRRLVIREIRKVLPDATIDEVGDEATLAALLGEGRRWDVAITDYELRWSTGMDVFHRLRAERAGLPVILFTASGNEELAVDALKQGVDDYITKTPRHYGRVPYAAQASADRRRQRDEAARAALDLRRSEALLTLALEAAAMDAWEYRPTTGRLRVHGHSSHLIGITGEDVRLTEWLAALADEDAERLRAAFDASGEQGTRFDLEFPVPRSARWWRIAGTRNDQGNLVGIVEEITGRKHIESRLRDADRLKDQYIATLGHELRNPLAPIRYALGLLDTHTDASRVEQARDVIARQTDTMAGLLDRLLDTSRISGGQVALDRTRLDLRSILREAETEAGPRARAFGHVLALSLPDEPVCIEGDRLRLRQVIDNLLQNAIKFTPEGGRITMALQREGRFARLAVTDTGVGIPHDMLGRVFEPLVQLDAGLGASTLGGLGVGLALVRQLVELHGGQVTAHSAGPSQGTTIDIRLPLCGSGPEDPVHARTTSRPAPRKVRVLVADDQPDAANSLALALELCGHDVRTAHDGLQAQALAQQWQPDVMLLDIGMPGMTGDLLARYVRQQPWGSRVRLVAVTGWGSDKDRRRLADAGFDAHHVKPVAVETLLKELEIAASAVDQDPGGDP